nr:Chain G, TSTTATPPVSQASSTTTSTW O-GlcNac peptide [synthetic construct]6BYJ_P Chain P, TSTTATPPVSQASSTTTSTW O-GlcNac peptide [synthetic construct]6BYJ_T Chain T, TSTTATPPVSQASSTTTSTW O-GlcNac peptide [synthetic construct]6BZD_G Chain G, GlcNAcylated peptide [synthetic construct]6BZD_K Chain K, GlcNAcylated peptide [synthetic construct]
TSTTATPPVSQASSTTTSTW